MKTFSVNYYNNNQRQMRLSRNIVVPSFQVEDIVIENIPYELMYAMYDGKKYKIANILTKKSTRAQVILDLQQVR